MGPLFHPVNYRNLEAYKQESLHFKNTTTFMLVTGLSALQYVNLNSSRNLYIIGFSVFFSIVSSQ
jgi:hypothetical protein